MHSHDGGDMVEIMSSSPELSTTKPGAPPMKTTRFAEPAAVSSSPAPEAMPSSNSNHLAGNDDDDDSSSDAAVVAPAKKWRSSALLSAPSRAIRQLVPRELCRATSFHHRRRVGSGVDDERSTTAAARSLDGLRFIGATRWEDVATRFDVLTADQGGLLYRSQFGQCIGMKEMEKKANGEGKKTTKDERAQQSGGFCCFFGDGQEIGSANNQQHASPAAVAATHKTKPADKPDFAGELFDALSRRRTQPAGPGDGISKDEMLEFWKQMNSTSFDTRLQTLFDMVDKNGDGTISEEEIKEMIMLSASENKLSLIRDHAEEYARVIMEALDPDNLGFIALHNVESLLLRQSPSQPSSSSQRRRRSSLSRLRTTTRITAETAAPPSPPEPKLLLLLRHVAYFLEDYWRRVWTLKLNMALVLLPVSRNTITWILNHTTATSVIPLAADSLNFHKVIAVAIAGAAALHAASHLACDFPRLLHATDAEYHPLGQRYFGFPRPDTYWWFVRGTEGWTGLVIVAIMAVAFTLATPWFRRAPQRGRWLPELVKKVAGFNAFWYAHHCFVAVYALLLVHGQFLYLTREWYKKTTWMYLAVPMAVYAGERLTRAVRSRVRPAKVIGADVYPGNVLSLRFDVETMHGRRFRYKSGQYVFLNCAAVSPFEWHPFSITSAPQDDYVSVHIRDAGDWTHKLKEIFEKAKNKEPTGQLPTENDHDIAITNPNWPKVRIDGPYGAPAQDYKQYDVVLLVGMGIGATPMISIIKDILNNMKHHLNASGDVEAGTAAAAAAAAAPSSSSSFRTRCAYFYWVTREQGTFDWFHKVMDEVVEADMEGVIELHNHCTTVYEEGDARSILISMLQSISQAKDGIDVVSGTSVRTHFGRPNWPRVYRRIADNHRHQRVGVFYCGNQVLTKELRELAQDFSRNSSTKFEFHKEIF
nr:unnamed protein product [Digitaria exilis]